MAASVLACTTPTDELGMRREFTVALDVQARLGEGLHWDHERSVLWMVDIHGYRLLQWDVQSTTWQEWRTPERLGWVIPCAGSDELLLGLQGGMALARASELPAVHWVARPFEGRPQLRLNDAKADASGAVWAGSMNNDDGSCSDGSLFRLSADGQLTTVDHGYQVANGPAIHPNGRLMLHTDSARRAVYAFDLDAEQGRLTNRRVWRHFAGDEGYPDGMCFDAEGSVWIAHWGASCVSRFTVDGALLRRVHLPALHVTNVCFGGRSLERMFVTSAFADRPNQPLDGALFEISDPGVTGVAAHAWGKPGG